MSVTYSLFYLLALWAFVLGVASGLLYELFRLLHRMHPRASWLIFLEDLLFCLICVCGLLLLFFNLSYGRMRLYAFVFMAIGFLLWYFTVGKVFQKSLSRLARLVHPHVVRAKMWGYTNMQTFLVARGAKRGFGGSSFIRRKKDA